ncbi:MAG: acetylornithine deacetylase [Phycisphaerae bacterium]|nr:acetylornithine deacetylase [Phycisphaerae bacterium]|tara:strand:- start:848 stop:2005 length:1158 start_codon:yes stop_codon:yes gene_type:complete
MSNTPLDDRSLLGKLVGFDTTSSRSNREVIDFICNYLDLPGVTLDRFDAGEGKENLVAQVGGPAEPASGLTLSGHLDCVPAGDGWTGDAFDLQERNGLLYARGSCDMKGFDALAINSMRAAADRELAHPLAMVLTCDEEIGGVGAAALVDAWPEGRVLPRDTIIGEPTMLEVVRMHKGHMKFKLVQRGQSAHSGSPHLGRNATSNAGRVLGLLQQLGEDFQKVRTASSPSFADVPNPVLCVVGVDAGVAWNIVPEHCEIRCSMRVLPDQDPVEMIAQIERAMEGLLDDEQHWSVEVFNDNPPLCTPREAAIHQELCQVMGQESCVGVSYCSDGGHLSRLGLDCVLWGPGSIEQAHMPDEFLAVDQFMEGRRLLDQVVDARCGGGE